MTAAEYDVRLFDLDGTLVDAERSYMHEVFDEVGRRLGCEFDRADARALWHDVGDTRRRVFERQAVDVERFWEVFDSVADPVSRAESTFLYEDAEFVADLDGAAGIVTHCPPAVTDRVLDLLDIGDWFDAVVCCSPELGMKPDPAPVRRAMTDLGATDGESGMLVGDGAHDVGAAWNAGLHGAHVERYDPHDRGYCVVGDYRVSDLAELEAVL